jgi:hypothetical protein
LNCKRPIKFGISMAALSATLILAACGGGGSPATTTTDPTVTPVSTPTQATTSYSFITPALNASHTTAITIVDDSGHVINQAEISTVKAVSADGSFLVHREDPSNTSVSFGGRSYSVQPVDFTQSQSGQTIQSINSKTLLTCIYSPHGMGPDYPVSLGSTWGNTFTETCGSAAAVMHTFTGSVVGLDTVTVPAGTFSTLKSQSTDTYTDAKGAVHTDTYITWRDITTGGVVKQTIGYAYSGTPQTTGHPVSRVSVLVPSSYNYATPTVNQTRKLQRTLVDDAGNIITLKPIETVTAVSANTFTVAQTDPDKQGFTFGGTTYAVQPLISNRNASGQVLNTVTKAAVPPVTCTDSPHGAGPDFPLYLGKAWSISYTEACVSSPPVKYTQTGSVVGLEDVTVPAGTFFAVKLFSTLTFTDAAGLNHVETVTSWRDAATGRLVKQLTDYGFDGAAPTTGHPVSETLVLLSEVP